MRNLAEELSYNDDPKIQAQIANHGHNVYYSDNTADGILKLVARPIPAGFHSDWDRLLVSDGSAPGVRINYVSMVGDKDYFADIVDNETSLHQGQRDRHHALSARPSAEACRLTSIDCS